MEHFIYLAATYDSGAYGACTYQGECATSSISAPDTGFLAQPQFMVPLIIVGAILIATLILVAKKIIRKAKTRH